jgi:lipoprotein-anchoring transpeptidase ErfK/SrfK
MRKALLFIILPLALILGALISIFSGSLSSGRFASADTTFTPLPENKRLAQRELAKAQKSLDRLKPKSPYIVIDTHDNKLYLRTENSILFKATCSTGTGGILTDSLTGRKWVFNTPRGVFRINTKLKQPWWRKPDWAFIEEGEKPPKSEDERLDPEMLGDYAMGFGDGYFIHGTIYERLLGVSVTHGCVRLGSEDLKYVYDRVRPGTAVYIF